ncbi:MAG: hypothetical protein AAF183_05000 [Pseudomonadota bacterium]
MSLTIDGIDYPESWDDLIKDGDLMKVFKSYSKKAGIELNYLFLGHPIDPSKHYAVFISPKSSNMINISHAARQPMVDLWESGDYGRDPRWKDLIKAAKAEVQNMLEGEHLIGRAGFFWKSEIFKKYHAIQLEKKAARENTGGAKLDRKKLGIIGFQNHADARVQAALQAMIAEAAAGNESGAKKSYEKVQKLEPKGSMIKTTDYKDMMKSLKRLKLAA